jgi:ABC-type phosphate/phosphonate transport system permease subunit
LFEFFKTLFPSKYVIVSDNGFITSLLDKFFEFIYNYFSTNFFSVVVATIFALTFIVWLLRNFLKEESMKNLLKISFSNPIILLFFLTGFFYFLLYPVKAVIASYEGNGK